MAELKGQCLCEKIAYEYKGNIGNLVHCHCSRCRKWHGAAFRSRIVVKASGFKWLSGESEISRYQSTPNVVKTFCKNCGSNLITEYPNKPEIFGLPIAGTEGELGEYKEFHVFTDNKASWWQIADEHPQYNELPPEKELIHCINE